MTLKITAEQRAALLERGSPVAVEDEQTRQVYFLVDSAMLDSLWEAADLAALRVGISDADAGRLTPLDEAMHQIETNLKARFSR